MNDPTKRDDDDPDAARVRDAMQALRRHDERSAPGFAATWSAARRRMKPARRWTFFVAGGAVGGAATLATVGAVAIALVTMRGSSAPSSADAPAAMATAAIGGASSAVLEPVVLPRPAPLAFLLRAPGRSVIGGDR